MNYPLWVDAICINQVDKKEKSSQVRRMRDIYETAQTGIAWIGPATPKSIATLLNIRDISKIDFPELEPTPGSEGTWRVWVDNVLDILRRRHLALGDFDGVDALQEFFTRSFWTRMWIVQEIAVGREVLVLCGDDTIHWQELNIGYHRLYVCAIFILGTRDLAKTPTEVALENMWLRYARGPNVLDAQTLFVRKEPPTLQQLLHFVSGRGTESSLKAYDPHDMIYAILGEISDREELGLSVDYRKPFQDVYIDVARYLLSQGHPDTLYHSQSATMRAGLPTWVTNWAAPLLPRINESTSGNRPPRFCCAGQGNLSVNFPENSSGRAILEVSGVEVDLISEIGEEIPFILDLQSVSNFLVQFRLLLEKGRHLPEAPRDLEDALWRIPVANEQADGDIDKIFRRPPDYLRASYDAICGTIQNDKLLRALTDAYKGAPETKEHELGASIGAVTDPLHTATQEEKLLVARSGDYYMALETKRNHRPFISKQGFVGLGPSAMVSGDVLAMFFGAPAPLVLRPTSDDQHQIMGGLYLYDMMEGQFMARKPQARLFSIV